MPLPAPGLKLLQQRLAFLLHFILNVVNIAPGGTALGVEPGNLLQERLLCLYRFRQVGLPAQRAQLVTQRAQFLLGGGDFVIRPLINLAANLPQPGIAGFVGTIQRCLGQPFGIGRQAGGDVIR